MKHISTCQVMWTKKHRNWAPKNLPKLHQRLLQSEILTVWCGIATLKFLALTSVKTTKVQPLLWHPSAMWQCYATSVNQSYVVVGSISHQYGFSKMEQQPTQQGHQWVFCGKSFHNTSFPVAAMFHGRHVRLISPPMITFYGSISKAEFSSLSLEP